MRAQPYVFCLDSNIAYPKRSAQNNSKYGSDGMIYYPSASFVVHAARAKRNERCGSVEIAKYSLFVDFKVLGVEFLRYHCFLLKITLNPSNVFRVLI